ncbi:MAG: MFS transporter [Psittacicella sp.]
MQINQKKYYVIFILSIIFLSFTLRSPIVALGAIIQPIKESINVSYSSMGIIGSLPILVFGLCSILVAKFSNKFGVKQSILTAIIIIIIGGVIRSSLNSFYTLLLGTIIMSIGIAIANVLLSVAIKTYYPKYIYKLTILQVITFNISTALATALSIPINNSFNWRVALLIWILIGTPAFFLWIKADKTKNKKIEDAKVIIHHDSNLNVLKSGFAWQLAFFMGMNSFIAYSLFTWIPTILAFKNVNIELAASYNTLFQISGIIGLILLLFIKNLIKIQKLLITFSIVGLIGMIGIWIFPAFCLSICMIFLGTSIVICFTLALTVIGIKTSDPKTTTSLSGMAQTIGYITASTGPFMIGIFFNKFHNLNIALLVLSISCGIQVILGYFVGKQK